MDDIFAWERTIAGKRQDERGAVRMKIIESFVANLRAWLALESASACHHCRGLTEENGASRGSCGFG